MVSKRYLGLLPVMLVFLAQTSCAPKAKIIEGEIGQKVQEGITNGKESFDHSKFDAILRRYSKPDTRQFDYAGLKAQQGELESFLQQVSRADLARLSRSELLAFFINTYNAYTIKTILDTMTPDRPAGVASIRDIPNVFGVRKHAVGGSTLSLDNIEHNILRPFFKDPRIHFAVNCASVSCPALANHAFTGANIDEQLDAVARRTLQSPDYLRIEGDRLLLTKILDWYGSDFVKPGYRGAASSLVEAIKLYTAPEVQKFIAARGDKTAVGFMPYDWSLNKVR
jgi:hypothetical protein